VNPHYPRVAERAGHRCEYCHAPEAIFNFPFEVEHILASSRQGTDRDTNLALSCRACNLGKAAHLHRVDELTGVETPLYHPRQDRWEDHLQVMPDGVIVGKTPVGRVTVRTLKMNAALQIEARRQWMRLGLFP
jgi:hypothetical protein